jgi:hypothetical protein
MSRFPPRPPKDCSLSEWNAWTRAISQREPPSSYGEGRPPPEQPTRGNNNDPFVKYRDATLYGSQDIERDLEYDMIAPGWVPSSGYTVFLGHFDSGKTTGMMDFACRLACDMDWTDTLPLQKDWAVCWISAEDPIGVTTRKRAWTLKHGVEPSKDRWVTIEAAVELTSAADVQGFAEYVKEEVHRKLGSRRILFVVDTLQRMTEAAKSQSDDADMTAAMSNLEALVSRFDGPAITACHPPKSEPRENPATVMGSSTIVNKSQCVIQCIDEGGSKRKLRVMRIKGAQRGAYLRMTLEPVSYEDGKGVVRSSVVPAIIAAEDSHAAVELAEQEHAMRREAYGEWIVSHVFGGQPGQETVNQIALTMGGQSYQAANGSTVTFGSESTLRKPGVNGLPTILSEPYVSNQQGVVLSIVDDLNGRIMMAETHEDHDIRVGNALDIYTSDLMSP